MERENSPGLTKSEGRKFGLSVGTAFLALAGLLWWRGHETALLVPLVLGAGLAAGGLVMPGKLGPVYRAWMRLAEGISRITTPIFMGIIYYLVVTPIGLLMRITGNNPIARPGEEESYWVRREDDGRKKSDMQRQF